ncbi:helix-turn-helix transcriptional regulator [Burkholderia sp. BCC1977]|uniref:helix-turn-helix transcriptional regulator n=1 Tax=Burkholderia sp. BCC1977 TaxID=2817440 RepID=UPI002ABDAD43|nr:LuxR C-terminal-related transcriptional regulator [Burkholderia sp. BCC1977]
MAAQVEYYCAAGASRLHTLTAAGAVLGSANGGVVLDIVLEMALGLLSLSDGLIACVDGGFPEVLASRGDALAVGTRLLDGFVIEFASRSVSQPLVRWSAASCPPMRATSSAGFDVLVPLRAGGRCAGVLVLLAPRAAPWPSTEDLAALQVLGVMLTAALQTTAHRHARRMSNVGERLSTLTPRERQVFALLPRGLTNAEIAVELGVTKGTIKSHVERILHKLGVTDRTQAAVRAAGLEAAA